MDKELIVVGFKSALFFLDGMRGEELKSETFSASAEEFISKLADNFISVSALETIYEKFTHTSAEYTLSEQIGHDLYLTVLGHGAGFWDRPEIYNDYGDMLTDICETITINDIWECDNLIEIE